MKKSIFSFICFTFYLLTTVQAQTIALDYESHFPDDEVHFIIANDLGRNGYYEQKNIASLMGKLAESSDIEFIAAAGDIHHFGGVASIQDPLWMTNYELIYDHPDLMIDWYSILGNHEYRGNTQAVIDYSGISRRWVAPARYFDQRFPVGDEGSCLLVYIDTTPMMDKYREDTETYPDAVKQDYGRQLYWIDSVLVNSDDKWKIVIGHHPVFAQTTKDNTERSDMQERLMPVLERNNVDVYFCGHIHNFQHIRPSGKRTEYVVNSSASLARPVGPVDGTKFCSPDAGFTVCSVSPGKFTFSFINYRNELIYRYTIDKD